jgi:hypothetical protein
MAAKKPNLYAHGKAILLEAMEEASKNPQPYWKPCIEDNLESLREVDLSHIWYYIYRHGYLKGLTRVPYNFDNLAPLALQIFNSENNN